MSTTPRDDRSGRSGGVHESPTADDHGHRHDHDHGPSGREAGSARPGGARHAAVVTASDGVSHGARDDESGRVLAEALANAGFDPVQRRAVPDDRARLVEVITALRDAGARLVVVTGGTGLGPRDVTPEALADLAGRAVPGFGEAMRAVGRASTPLADLSRSGAVAVGPTLVLAVPGSPRGAVESYEAIADLVPHALDLLAGDTAHADEPQEAARAEVARGHPRATGGAAHGQPGHVHDEGCAVAHGDQPDPGGERAGTLMAVFASPLSALLLAWGRELGWSTVLVDPRVTRGGAGSDPAGGDHEADGDPAEGDHEAEGATEGGHEADGHRAGDGRSPGARAGGAGPTLREVDGIVVTHTTAAADATTDIVVTDHHREELVDLLDAALDTEARFIGLMGSRRQPGPHVEPLRARGRTEADLARIVRPIGIDIGSRTPAEIAVSTLADLVARRSARRAEVDTST